VLDTFLYDQQRRSTLIDQFVVTRHHHSQRSRNRYAHYDAAAEGQGQGQVKEMSHVF